MRLKRGWKTCGTAACRLCLRQCEIQINTQAGNFWASRSMQEKTADDKASAAARLAKKRLQRAQEVYDVLSLARGYQVEVVDNGIGF
jgi:predicted nuclease of restriction endonuclease-like (RecB) superfamily